MTTPDGAPGKRRKRSRPREARAERTGQALSGCEAALTPAEGAWASEAHAKGPRQRRGQQWEGNGPGPAGS